MSWCPSEQRYEKAAFRRCGKSGLKLPAISLGLWHNFGGVDTLENQRAMLRRAFDLGITHFDLANNYGPPPGSAEENFGRILNTDFAGLRDELVISTKAGYLMWPGPYGEWGSRKYLLASLDQSLRRMGLEYVDIFYSHRPDPDTPPEETMSALAHAVRQGKALYAGISSYSAEQTQARAATPPGGLKPQAITEDKLARVRKLHPLAKTRGQTLAQMALAWVLRDQRMTSALIGASRVEQIEENVKALANAAFGSDELARIDAILKRP
ncbi:MAG: aldo/keto reductase [Planctomycetota bacterium]|nr:aldo/keto reductase [Planctomycetota bacterium]